jgi:hypothetical protein
LRRDVSLAGGAVHLKLVDANGARPHDEPTSVTLFDQGLTQVLEAAATGLQPHAAYVLAPARKANGTGSLEPLSAFTTNAAGSAIVNAVGPIRQVLRSNSGVPRRYLVIVPGTPALLGAPVQIQSTH